MEKREPKDSEDVVMEDRSEEPDPIGHWYEDLSSYEGEDDAVVAPPTTKKRTAPRSAARAGKSFPKYHL